MSIKRWVLFAVCFFVLILAAGIFFVNARSSPSQTMGLASSLILFANNNISDTYVFTFTHQGINYSANFSVSKTDYLFYKDQKRTWCCGNWNQYVTPDDSTILQIADEIKNISQTTKDKDPVSLAIDFAESITYQTDKNYNGDVNYPKFPIETVVDQRGDCKDKSFLTAALLKDLGVKTVLLFYKLHAAVGVDCPNCTGTYFMYNGTKYYFLETTAGPDRWKIGYTTQQFIDETPIIEQV